MTQKQLNLALDYVTHSRKKRAEMSAIILDNPQLIASLLKIAFSVDNPISKRACWVMEFTAKENLAYIFPYLNTFTENLNRVHFDSSIRPMAKICEYLLKEYFSDTSNEIKVIMNDIHLERMTSACFDWLIGKYKVAPKAYSMTCLLLLGRKFSWIHPELKILLEQNYSKGSTAYKARARMTLAKI